MIARFRVLLKFILHLPEGEPLQPARTADGKITFHPPYQCQVVPGQQIPLEHPQDKLIQLLRPAMKILQDEAVRKVNGKNAIPVNALQIDFHAPTFVRGMNDPDDSLTPTLSETFAVLNGFIDRIRAITCNPELLPIGETDSLWFIEYLNDDGSELEVNPEFTRTRFGMTYEFKGSSLTPTNWSQISELPLSFQLPPWIRLYLDARYLLPQVGPAVVFAATALETLIERLMEYHSPNGGVAAALMDWIQDRGDWRKEPSQEEMWGGLLKILTEHSLLEQRDLWRDWHVLKNARNNFVHRGVPKEGRNCTGKIVDASRAAALLDTTWQIIKWAEKLLPLPNDRSMEARETTVFDFAWPRFTAGAGSQFKIVVADRKPPDGTMRF